MNSIQPCYGLVDGYIETAKSSLNIPVKDRCIYRCAVYMKVLPSLVVPVKSIMLLEYRYPGVYSVSGTPV